MYRKLQLEAAIINFAKVYGAQLASNKLQQLWNSRIDTDLFLVIYIAKVYTGLAFYRCHLQEVKGIAEFPDQPSRTDEFKEELRTVIDLMGPETPHLKSLSDNNSDISRSSLLERSDKEKIQKMVQQPDAKPLSVSNTPRDVSEMTSLATDSIALYMDCSRTNFNCGDGDYEKNNAQNYEESVVLNLNPSKLTTEIGSVLKHPLKTISSVLRTKSSLHTNNNLDLYRINILQPKNETAPKRVIFDLVEELPKPIKSTAATNTSPKLNADTKLLYSNSNCTNCNPNRSMRNQNSYHDSLGIPLDFANKTQKRTIYQRNSKSMGIGGNAQDCLTRVDVYYFDHGNASYYHTTDSIPVIMTEILAERVETMTTKFWAEVFGSVHILFSFMTSFILQLTRFLLQSFVKPLTIGFLQLISDYCLKPLLATIFNALIQPPLILLYNTATTLRDICDPLAEGIGYFLRELAIVLKAIRLVEVKSDCSCKKKQHHSKESEEECKNNAHNNI